MSLFSTNVSTVYVLGAGGATGYETVKALSSDSKASIVAVVRVRDFTLSGTLPTQFSHSFPLSLLRNRLLTLPSSTLSRM